MRLMANICPVCGYSMERPAADYRICPSCGTEFGYDDAGRSYATLRSAWLRAGAHWWSRSRAMPAEWDPFTQLNAVLTTAIPWHMILFGHHGHVSTSREQIGGIESVFASPPSGNNSTYTGIMPSPSPIKQHGASAGQTR